MRIVAFIAETGGDGECFVWRGATEADRAAVVGVEQQAKDRLEEIEFQKEHAQDFNQKYDPGVVDTVMRVITPGDVCHALGVKRGKRYRFTISVEEV